MNNPDLSQSQQSPRRNLLNPQTAHTFTNPWSDPISLAANTNGDITPEQRRSLEIAMLLSFLGACILWFFFLLVVPAILIGLSAINALFLPDDLFRFAPFGLLFPLVLFIICYRFYRRYLSNKFMLDHIQVQQSQGQIAWSGNAYKASIPGLTLRSLTDVLPAPGMYQCYYVIIATKGYLLSIEPSPPHEPISDATPLAQSPACDEQSRSIILQALATTNHFSLDDLAKNRQGLLSGKQKRRLFRSLILLLCLYLFIFAVGSIFIIIPATLFWGSSFPAFQPLTGTIYLGTFGDSWPFWLCLIVGVGVCLGSLISMFQKTFRAGRDLLLGRVAFLEGCVQAIEQEYHSKRITHTNYYYRLGELDFQVSSRAANALVKDLRYRIYYSPAYHALLSIEPLE